LHVWHIATLVAFLVGLLFFAERKTAAQTTTIAGIFLLYFGITDVVGSTLHRGFGINEVVAGIPSFFFSLMVITWIWFRRAESPLGLYWTAIFSFSYFGIFSLIPEASFDPPASSLLATLALSIVVCTW